MTRTVFRYSWKVTLAYLAGGVLLATLCIALGRVVDDPRHALHWLTGAFLFFSAGMAWMLIRPRVLELDSDGFTLSGGFKPTATKIPWRDVTKFYLYQAGRGTETIGYHLKGPARDHTRFADGPPAPPRAACLPWGWDEPLEHVVRELERYRQAAVGPSAR